MRPLNPSNTENSNVNSLHIFRSFFILIFFNQLLIYSFFNPYVFHSFYILFVSDTSMQQFLWIRCKQVYLNYLLGPTLVLYNWWFFKFLSGTFFIKALLLCFKLSSVCNGKPFYYIIGYEYSYFFLSTDFFQTSIFFCMYFAQIFGTF